MRASLIKQLPASKLHQKIAAATAEVDPNGCSHASASHKILQEIATGGFSLRGVDFVEARLAIDYCARRTDKHAQPVAVYVYRLASGCQQPKVGVQVLWGGTGKIQVSIWQHRKLSDDNGANYRALAAFRRKVHAVRASASTALFLAHSALGSSRQLRSRVATIVARLTGIFTTAPLASPAISSALLPVPVELSPM